MENKKVKSKVKKILENLKERIDKKLKENGCCCKKDGEGKC